MQRLKTIFITALVAAAGIAQAAPTPEEIKQLGTTLTEWGAEKAGNKDGTIPAYTGGLTKPPARYSSSRPTYYPDPFPEDKPLFSIDAKNMDKYGDKIADGVKAMMRKYPTFHIDVYQTRRLAAYPQHVLDNTLKNTTRCHVAEDTKGLNSECWGGIPFPIPKDGYEVMWNHTAAYRGGARMMEEWPTYVKPDGELVTTGKNIRYTESGIYNPRKPGWSFAQRVEYSGPPRLAGMISIYYDRENDLERLAWNYVPAARRVRLAPDFAADTPIAPIGGAAVYDDLNMFVGKMDRFDFKLVGKQEMYIPINNYKLNFPEKGSVCEGDSRYMPYHMRPECIRWELRRVWHVHASLKPGKRHVYKERDFYYEEDAWYGGLFQSYDMSGKIYRVGFDGQAPDYVHLAPVMEQSSIYDLSSGTYVYIQLGPRGTINVPYLKPEELAPESMTQALLKFPSN